MIYVSIMYIFLTAFTCFSAEITHQISIQKHGSAMRDEEILSKLDKIVADKQNADKALMDVSASWAVFHYNHQSDASFIDQYARHEASAHDAIKQKQNELRAVCGKQQRLLNQLSAEGNIRYLQKHFPNTVLYREHTIAHKKFLTTIFSNKVTSLIMCYYWEKPHLCYVDDISQLISSRNYGATSVIRLKDGSGNFHLLTNNAFRSDIVENTRSVSLLEPSELVELVQLFAYNARKRAQNLATRKREDEEKARKLKSELRYSQEAIELATRGKLIQLPA